MPSPFPTKFLLLCLGTVAFVACGTDRQDAPLAPTSVSRAVSSTPCSNFSFMRNDAKAYFASGKDLVIARINAMETAYQANVATPSAANQAVVDDAGLSVLARVGTALNEAGALKGTPAIGDVLVKDVLLCSTIGTVASGFSFADALGPNGLFGVRGGSGDVAGALTSRGTPIYGAEPQYDKTWANSASKRFLMYGYLLSSFSTIEASITGAKPFEVSTLPAVTFANQVLVGECLSGTESYPIQHVASILPNVVPTFCSSAQVMAPTETNSGFFALVSRAADLFTPRPAYAFGFSGSGGLISGLSPFFPVKVKASNVSIKMEHLVNGVVTPQFTNKNVGDKFTLVITIRTTTAPTGTPLADVPVTVLVSGNSGSFTQPTPTSGLTKADGTVTFADWSLDKAGGYTITASAPVLGAGFSVSSNLFNVKNK
jgi:hypothetical protein